MTTLLLEKGAHIDAQNTHGYTPLISAIFESRDFSPRKFTCNVHSTHQGATPPRLTERHMAVILLLIEKGCNLNLPTLLGNAPLSVAYDMKYSAVVDALLAAGCALNALNSDGLTVLHKAVLLGEVSMVRKLLDRGADMDAADVKGWSPLDCAMGALSSAESSLLPFSTPLNGKQLTSFPLNTSSSQCNPLIKSSQFHPLITSYQHTLYQTPYLRTLSRYLSPPSRHLTSN